MKKVSVIMPLYNAEKYMTEAIEGILNQTYGDFELLCIDDHSTDNTAGILNDIAQKEQRIRILTNGQRLGAGESRNRGLREAAGKYVVFLDGDDVFHEKLLETTCEAMERCEADVVLFDAARHVAGEHIHIRKATEYTQEFVERYCIKTFCIHDFPTGEFPLGSDAIGDKMFLKSFIMDNRLQFQDLASSNDVYFVRMALYCAAKIIWARSDEMLLYTREHSEPSRISNNRDPMCAYYAWEKLARELSGRNMLEDLQQHFYSTFAGAVVDRIQRERSVERREDFYRFLQREGIGKCMAYSAVNRDKIDAYTLYILDGIQKNPCESGWIFSMDSCFQFYLRKNGEKICRFLQELPLQEKKTILWGAGHDGTALLEYLDGHSIRLSGVVDCSTEKQGTVVWGYEITAPDFFEQEADHILVTSKRLEQEVSGMVKHTKAVVVNLLTVLL